MDNKEVAKYKEHLTRSEKSIYASMPDWADKKRLLRFAAGAIDHKAELRKCTYESLCKAVAESFRTGLEIETTSKEAYLVPRGRTCCFEVSYIGLLKLAQRIPEVGAVTCDVVYERDEFRQHPFTHNKYLGGDPGKIIAAYARYHHTRSNVWVTKVLTKHEIDTDHRAHSPGSNSESSPWNKHYKAMCIKSCIRELYKEMPKSTTMGIALNTPLQYDAPEGGFVKDVTQDVEVGENVASAASEGPEVGSVEPVDIKQ